MQATGFLPQASVVNAHLSSRDHLERSLFAASVPTGQELEACLGLDSGMANFLHTVFKAVEQKRYGGLPAIFYEKYSQAQWGVIFKVLDQIATDRQSGPLAIKALRVIDFFRADSFLRKLWKSKEDTQVVCEDALAESTMFSHSRISRVREMFAATSRVSSVVSDRFRPLVCHEEKGEKGISVDSARIQEWNEEDAFPKEVDGVLQTSVENAWHSVGGVAVVVKGRQEAQDRQAKYNMWGYYPLHMQEMFSEDFADLVPFGVVSHWYNFKKVESTIWLSAKHKCFFVMPSTEHCWGLFDLISAEKIYDSTLKANLFERSVYMGASLASFALQYNPKGVKSLKVLDGVYLALPKNFRVILADANLVGSTAFEIMSVFCGVMASKVREAGISWIAPIRIGLLHGHGRFDIPESLYRGVGIQIKPDAQLSLYSHFSLAISADVLVPVSGAYARRLLTDDPALSERFSLLPKALLKEKMEPIINGIQPGAFDYTAFDVLGDFASIFRRSPMEGKATLLRKLFDQGIIAHPTAFLAVFVGRYTYAKGVFMLEAMFREVIRKGGQVVCMGLAADEIRTIEALQAKAKDPNDELYGKVVIYTRPQEQGDFIPGTTVKRGTAIRAASSLTLMPSVEEPMGLVALEAMLFGSLPVVPQHEGFVDTCRPINNLSGVAKEDTLHEEGNAIMYPGNQSKTPSAGAGAIAWAVEHYIQLDAEIKDQMVTRIRERVINTHSWYQPSNGEGVISKYTELYDRKIAERKIEGIPVPKKAGPTSPSLWIKIASYVKGILASIGGLLLSCISKALRSLRVFKRGRI